MRVKLPLPSSRLTPSAVALLLANMIPLAGVIVWHWSVFAVVILFWMENVVVGGFNALRMLLSQGNGLRGRSAIGAKLAMTTFFCIHYGIFTAVHGIFVVVLFGSAPDESIDFGAATIWHKITQHHLQWVIPALIVSHGFSFLENYIGKGEYLRTNLAEAMNAPYGRILVLHLTILGGGFLLTALGEPRVGVVLLVVLKTILDLRAHLKEHRDLGPDLRQAGAPGQPHRKRRQPS